MNSVATLAQALGLAYASGLNVYATVATVGLASRIGVLDNLPAGLAPLGNTWVIVVALALYVVEFIATMIPGIASAWDTVHSLIRPPAAAVLAAATAWHGDPAFVLLAALLGGGMAATTHAAKLGFRYAIDASPEPVTNTASNTIELGVVAGIAMAVWEHPYITLAIALALLVAFAMFVRLVWRMLRRVFAGHWMPGRGLLQDARTSPARPRDDDET